ncbi:uncharacterized protein LOC120913529 [Rana temporaria]|uniref:uncharacterized protein LOC120913529 n=1 Tax=Rana temporaria TaxID=8407 RepID=UPI001AADBABC|nr:uncharacterized protein LOC120913529 [Rana temporaria]
MRKENLILFFLVGLLQCYIGNAIRCYSCTGSCTDPLTTECAADQQCMTVEQIVGGNIQRQQKYCATSQQCNILSSDPSLVQKCCNTDLCNGGNIPLSTASTASTAGTASTASTAGTASTAITASTAGTNSSSFLKCNSCNFYECVVNKNTVTCNRGEVCVTTTAYIVGVPVKKLSCANTTICSTETSENIAGSRVSVSNTCCNQNYCNFAVNVKLSSIAAIGAVLLLWITKLS